LLLEAQGRLENAEGRMMNAEIDPAREAMVLSSSFFLLP